MLKMNSKKAIENIREYIIDNVTNGIEEAIEFLLNYSDEENASEKAAYYEDILTAINSNASDAFKKVAGAINDRFYIEKVKLDKSKATRQQLFYDWCQGLPSFLDTCYYYNRSAVDDLGAILEETEEEKARFTEQEAAEKLTYLIYRELNK